MFNNKQKKDFRNRQAPMKDPNDKFEEKVVEVKRTTKKTQGGSKIGFSALVVVGNRSGSVGMGLGKASDVSSAVQKALSTARKSLINVNVKGNTIAHKIEEKYGSARILLKPAPVGTGIIAGGSVRTVVELAGIKDISGKMLGSNNKILNVLCALEALRKLRV